MDCKQATVLISSMLWMFCLYVEAEIHRVKPQSMRTSPQGHHHPNSPTSDSKDGLIHTKNINSSDYTRGDACFYSIISSLIVSLSGILPLLILPIEAGPLLENEENARKLRLFLSFAVGSLLGDVFLHLLPESWKHINSSHQDQAVIGLWVLAGIFAFIILEKILPNLHVLFKLKFSMLVKDNPPPLSHLPEQNGFTRNGYSKNCANGFLEKENKTNNGLKYTLTNNGIKHKHKELSRHTKEKITSSRKVNKLTNAEITGYLNLLANFIDNFTHGLAVAASFLVSCKVGTLTTFAILIHEIPHEIGDFAILLKSGFDRYPAARAQLLTASGGLVGAVIALSAESPEEIGTQTAWILPFTAGGFINIALVNVLPDLLKESNVRESGKQILSMLLGIAIMATVTKVCD